jgi:hypothetical protein
LGLSRVYWLIWEEYAGYARRGARNWFVVLVGLDGYSKCTYQVKFTVAKGWICVIGRERGDLF